MVFRAMDWGANRAISMELTKLGSYDGNSRRAALFLAVKVAQLSSMDVSSLVGRLSLLWLAILFCCFLSEFFFPLIGNRAVGLEKLAE